MSLAKAKAVAHFANSAGCKLTEPKLIHDRDPFMSFAIKGVINNRTIKAMYKMPEKESKYLSSNINKNVPKPTEQAIQTNCLPERVLQLKKSVSPISWLAPHILNQPPTKRRRYRSITTLSARKAGLPIRLSFITSVIDSTMLENVGLRCR